MAAEDLRLFDEEAREIRAGLRALRAELEKVAHRKSLKSDRAETRVEAAAVNGAAQ